MDQARMLEEATSEGIAPIAMDLPDFSGEVNQDPQTQSKELTPQAEMPVLMTKFTLYESEQKFVIVGSNSRETRYRLLELNLDSSSESDFDVKEQPGTLTRSQVTAILASHPDLHKRITAWGILGCIRFTGPYYLCLVTKCSVVALLGGHYILHVDETRLLPLVPSAIYRPPDRRSAEARLASVFHDLDLTKTFYFSPSYDLTNTLQTNLSSEKRTPHRRVSREQMYVWNSHMLSPLLERFNATMEWCLALVHGFIDQSRISVFGNDVYITLIARRSHHFAGARFFKRGTNNQGYVANEVETEQIVSNQLTTSFHDGRAGAFESPRYTSYVQHRGSIPLSWSQLSGNMNYKPPIRLDTEDPFYSAAAKHFDRMFRRYGTPVMILNLVKLKERHPRESLLAKEFRAGVEYLNQFLPTENRLHYTAWDMSRAAKGRSAEVIQWLEQYAAQLLDTTGIFHNGESVQDGVCRTNCIDCLDRTNAAQSVIGKVALGHQLYAMGILDLPHLDYDTDAVDILTEMYHDHGDTLALQYGGSNLVNTVETYRKINQWTSHSRDLIESIRRFYTNSFVDAQRQDAINVFLGNYQYRGNGTAHLWDLATDYYLHNSQMIETPRPSYRFWFSPAYLQRFDARLEEQSQAIDESTLPAFQLQIEHHWARLYRPRVLTTLSSLFLMKMNSTERYAKINPRDPVSPFEIHTSEKQHSSSQSSRRSKRQLPSVSSSTSAATLGSSSSAPAAIGRATITAADSPLQEHALMDPVESLVSEFAKAGLGSLSSSTSAKEYEEALSMRAPLVPPVDTYAAYFQLPGSLEAVPEYATSQAEWTSVPVSQWTSAQYELYASPDIYV